jgi:phage/plasmid-like protein (TIGR03299 family)
MAHEITQRADGFAEMAYVGGVPWHGLGQALKEGASIEEWRKAAGMDWEALRAPVQFRVPAEVTGAPYASDCTMDERHVIYRSDTLAPLSVVSDKYEIFQPADVLGYFDAMAKSAGLSLETAGTLFGGKRFWALAKIGEGSAFDPDDIVEGRLLLATSVDGTIATTAKIVHTRVVCNNTLTFALDHMCPRKSKIIDFTQAVLFGFYFC